MLRDITLRFVALLNAGNKQRHVVEKKNVKKRGGSPTTEKRVGASRLNNNRKRFSKEELFQSVRKFIVIS